MKEFNKETIEQLKYYVYALIDPRNNKIFYVGKGTGNRVFAHANNMENSIKDPETEKQEIIKNIMDSGLEVKYYILRHGIDNEDEAFDIESTIIDFLTYPAFQNHEIKDLSNIQSGHNQTENGIKTIEEIEEFYSAAPIDIKNNKDLPYKFLAIKINKTFDSQATDESIYDGVRFCWKVKLDRVNKVDYVLAIYNGIIRGVYPCKDMWRKVKEGEEQVEQDKGRCCFDQPKVLTSQEKSELMRIKDILIRKRLLGLHTSQNPVAYFE